MSSVLSQEEIDTLLSSLSGGDLTVDPDGDSTQDGRPEVATFNFFNQDRIVRGGMPTLEVVHDRLARLMRTALTQMVRRPVDVQVLNHIELKMGEFNRTVIGPSSLHSVKLDPLKGYGLVVLPGKLIYTLLDIFFGGSGENAEKEDARDFTLIEQRVIANLTSMFNEAYGEAWKPIYPLTVECGGSETNPQFINIAQASETVTGVEYEIFIEDVKCGLSVCLPYATIEPIRDTLKGSVISESMDEQNMWAARLSRSLVEASVEIRTRLGTAILTVEDLVKLEVGDVIQLREDYEHPVELLVEGVSKFWGLVGSHKSARAVQITGVRKNKRE